MSTATNTIRKMIPMVMTKTKQTASVMVQDKETVDFVLNVEMGAMVRFTIDTIWGWSTTQDVNIIGISDEVTPEGWLMTLSFVDNHIPNEYGPFARAEFNSGFHLGNEE